MVPARRSRSSPITCLAVTSTPRLFSCSVMKSELVSTRLCVSISEPTAMISAFTWRCGYQPRLFGVHETRLVAASPDIHSCKLGAADADIHAEDRVGGGDDHGAGRRKRQANDARPGDEEIRFSVRRD